jgi:hypothetical protein
VRIRRSSVPVAPEETPAAPAPVPEIPDGVEIDIDDVGKQPAPEASPARTHAPKGERKILRKATDDDIAREEKNREREAEAFKVALDMITERELPMKLIRVEYSFDASRATFFFFSETRIDFRDLVKDLAYKLKSRIEMRQSLFRSVWRRNRTWCSTPRKFQASAAGCFAVSRMNTRCTMRSKRTLRACARP